MPIPPYHVHPMLVHFPIALLFVAGFFEWVMPVMARAQKERWQWIAAWLLWVGTLCSVFTVASGLWAESTAPAIPSALDTVELHEKMGIAAGVLALVLSVWRWIKRPPLGPRPVIVYFLLWAALLTVLGLTGFYGGRLVFDFGVGVDATSAG